MRIALLLLLFSPVMLLAQDDLPLGKGVVVFDVNKLNGIEFFVDTNNVQPDETIRFTINQVGVTEIEDAKNKNKWFVPEQFFPSYDVFILRVDEVKGDWMRLFVNTSGQLLWTKIATFNKFMSWPDFLMTKVNAIQKNDWYAPEIKSLPAARASTIKRIEPSDCFDVLEIRGEWIHIQTDRQSGCSETKKPVRSGWIKWKDQNRLTIAYSLVI